MQTIIVIAIITAAVAYTTYRMVRTLRSKGGGCNCGCGCQYCPKAKTKTKK